LIKLHMIFNSLYINIYMCHNVYLVYVYVYIFVQNKNFVFACRGQRSNVCSSFSHSLSHCDISLAPSCQVPSSCSQIICALLSHPVGEPAIACYLRHVARHLSIHHCMEQRRSREQKYVFRFVMDTSGFHTFPENCPLSISAMCALMFE